MGDVVNLNRFRKQRARKQREQEADRNRLRHGRTKEEKLKETLEADRRNRDLDGKKLDDPA